MARALRTRPRLAVLFDAVGENWPSMDLSGEMLFQQLRAEHSDTLEPVQVRPNLPRLFRRIRPTARGSLNADRALGRYLAYPALAWIKRPGIDAFHVVDHSYAHLVHALPARRTGVFCHDLDAFRCLLSPEREPRSMAFRALARWVLTGLQRAALVFVTTQHFQRALGQTGWVDADRIVCAPLGAAPEFTPSKGGRQDRPFVLHVGSAIPRKRLDLLLQVFARLQARRPELALVQVGAQLEAHQREQVERLGLTPFLKQPGPLTRAELAQLYRSASLVLLPSEEEGFGLPLLEALACGAPVLASDLPTLREVGGDAARYCPVGALEAWTEAAWEALEHPQRQPPFAARIEQASLFSWARHAGIIAKAYRRLLGLP